MKKAKQRPMPILARLVSSTRRANKSINSALAYVTASNRRLAKHKPRLARQLAENPRGLPADLLAWENMVPVGLEVVDYAQPTAVADIPPDSLEAQVPDVGLESVEKLRGMVRKPAKPVSIDAMNDAILAKVVVDADALKALIDEGRD